MSGYGAVYDRGYDEAHLDDHRRSGRAQELRVVPVATRPDEDGTSARLLRTNRRRFGWTGLLCLHKWGAHGHPSLTGPHHAKPGNGLLLFFRVDNFDVTLTSARALV